MNDPISFLDPNFGFFIILIIPISLWFFQKVNENVFIIGLIILLAFAEGSLQLLKILDPSANRLLREGLMLVQIFILIINKRQKPLILPGQRIVLLLISVSLLSLLLNNETTAQQYVLFTRRVMVNFGYFFIIANLSFTDIKVRNLINMIRYLFLVQIVVYFFKFFLFGVTEAYIGTISAYGGSLTNTLALIGIIYAISHYIATKEKKFIFLIICFFFVAIIGAKRGIIIFLAITLTYLYFIIGKIKFVNLIQFAIVLPLFFITFIMFTPTLNPENKMGAKPDISYAVDYISSRILYNKELAPGGTNDRTSAIYTYFAIEDINLKNILLGKGPGIAFPKNSYESDIYGGGEAFLNNKYGYGYGMRTGFLWITLQAGLLFTLLYVYFHFWVFKKYIFDNAQQINRKTIIFSKLFLLIFTLDFFTYSSTFVSPSVIPLVFYLFLGLLVNPSAKQAIIDKL
jgi:hypothetical protein